MLSYGFPYPQAPVKTPVNKVISFSKRVQQAGGDA